MMLVTAIDKPLPRPAAPIWSGTATIGRRNFLWFYWPRHWLHVQEQDGRNPRCWMNIDPRADALKQVRRAIRRLAVVAAS